MKKIWPSTTNTSAINSNNSTSDACYEAAINCANAAKQAADNACKAVTDLKSDLSNGLTTKTANANTVNGCQVNADLINAETVTTDHLTAGNSYFDLSVACVKGNNSNVYVRVNGNDVRIAGDVQATSNVNINGNVTSECVKTNHLCSQTGHFDALTVCNLSFTDLDANKALFGTSSTHTAAIEEADIDKASIQEAVIDSGKVSSAVITDAEIENAIITCADFQYITHTQDPQIVENTDEDLYILTPLFTNGSYNLEFITDDETKLGSIEYFNSISNLMFRWSSKVTGFLASVKYRKGPTGIVEAQLHISNPNGYKLNVFRQSNSYDNLKPPAIYTVDQWLDTNDPQYPVEEVVLTDHDGTYITNLIYTDRLKTKCLDMDTIQISELSVYESLKLTCCIDPEADPSCVTTAGDRYQFIQNRTGALGEEVVSPQWTSPSDVIATDDFSLPFTDTVARYTGEAVSGEGVVHCIVHLGDSTCVHGSISVEDHTDTDSLTVARNTTTETLNVTDTISSPNLYAGTAGEPDLTGNSLYIGKLDDTTEDICLYRNTEGRLDEIAAYNCESTLVDQKPFIYDATSNTIQTTDSLTIQDLTVDNLTVNCDAVIHGDLYVEGVTHTVEEETISTTSDNVVLRQNNPTAIADEEISGVVINNYDGSGNVALIGADNTGTVRVGTANTEDTTYTLIKYKDGKWYDEDNEELTPDGELVAWESKQSSDKETIYIKAIFRKFDTDNSVPVTARDEEANMTDAAITIWNKDGVKIKTIDVPTAQEMVLTGSKDEDGNVTYSWIDKQPGNYIFSTMAEYEASEDYIPVGSEIVILDQVNRLYGEDID